MSLLRWYRSAVRLHHIGTDVNHRLTAIRRPVSKVSCLSDGLLIGRIGRHPETQFVLEFETRAHTKTHYHRYQLRTGTNRQ